MQQVHSCYNNCHTCRRLGSHERRGYTHKIIINITYQCSECCNAIVACIMDCNCTYSDQWHHSMHTCCIIILCHTSLTVHSWQHNWKVVTSCLPFTVDSDYTDIVSQELIRKYQSEVRAAAVSCIHWVSRSHCWFILNLIVDGSIRVEWGQPVQFNSIPSWYSNHGQHAWWGGGCGE